MPSASREQTRTGPNLRVVHLSRPHRHFRPVITRARRSLRWTRSRFAPALVWDAADRATVPKVSAFLPSPLTEALVHLAKLADRSVSAEIRQAARAYLRSTDRPLRTGATPTPRRAYRRAYLERAKSSISSDVRSQAGQPRSARCAATTRRVRRSAPTFTGSWRSGTARLDTAFEDGAYRRWSGLRRFLTLAPPQGLSAVLVFGALTVSREVGQRTRV